MRTARPILILVIAVLVLIAGCGSDRPVETADDVTTTSSSSSTTTSLATTTTTPDDPCSDHGPGRFENAQFAFAGTVTDVELLVNQRDTDPENPEADPDAAPTPWVTFEVEAWYTTDQGATFRIWMTGMNPQRGDELLVGGDAFVVHLDGESPHSGEADPCLTEPATDETRQGWSAVFGGSVPPDGARPEGEPDAETVDAIRAAKQR